MVSTLSPHVYVRFWYFLAMLGQMFLQLVYSLACEKVLKIAEIFRGGWNTCLDQLLFRALLHIEYHCIHQAKHTLTHWYLVTMQLYSETMNDWSPATENVFENYLLNVEMSTKISTYKLMMCTIHRACQHAVI